MKINPDDSASEVIVKLLTEQVMDYIIIKYPLMALGIVNPISSFVVSRVIKVAVCKTELGVKFFAISKKVDREVVGHDIAKKELIEAIEKGNEDEIKKSKEAYINKLRDLVKLDSTNPNRK